MGGRRVLRALPVLGRGELRAVPGVLREAPGALPVLGVLRGVLGAE